MSDESGIVTDETDTPPEEAPGSGTEADAQPVDELAELRAKHDEHLNTLQRVQADFENFRKRVMRDQAQLGERATSTLVDQLLPVLDSFKLALMNIEHRHTEGGDGFDIASVRKGVELVFADLYGVLEKAGLTRIEALGLAFDPNEHDAVMQDDGDGDGDLIVEEVLRDGYRFKGRVIRPAMVKVKR